MLIMSVLSTGSFEFAYICKPCLNQTYNDEEDKMCKPMLE